MIQFFAMTLRKEQRKDKRMEGQKKGWKGGGEGERRMQREKRKERNNIETEGMNERITYMYIICTDVHTNEMSE